MPSGKYLAGGLQSGCTANLTGAQYNLPDFLAVSPAAPLKEQLRSLSGT